MAPPRGESGARLDTAAGRAAEAAFQQRKAAAAAQAAMRVAQAEAAAGRAAAAQAAMAAAAQAAQRAAPVVQQAVQAHTAQIVAAAPAAAPPPPPTPAPAPSPTSSTPPILPGFGISAVPQEPQIPRQNPIRDEPAPVKIEQWSPDKDRQYNEAVARGDMETAARLVAERDALIKANEDFHRANKTGPYAVPSSGGSTSTASTDAAEAAKAEARQAASAWLTTILRQYGMDGMSGSVDALVREWGTNTQVIAVKLRETQQYKDRFKGLLALQAKGVTDISNEADYIQQETAYRQVFREAGIQSYIGNAGSAAERDAIAKLVGDYSVSVDEVRSRVQDAQRVVADTAPEVTDALQRYYNVSPQDLVAFTLDPSRAKNRINDIANAAIIGGYAAQRGLNADVGTAESIASLSGTADVQMQALLPQLSNASIVADSTQRLASIEDTDLTDSQVLMSEFSLDSDADKKIKGLQSRERARFSGKSGITSSTLSRSSGV